MDSKKSDTIIKENHGGQGGFILPMVMIIMLLFTFYTMNAIEHLDNDRDFLKERRVAVSVDLQKKIYTFDLVTMLSNGSSVSKNGQLKYPESHVTYEITEPQTGIEMVKADLYLGNHHDSFNFLYDETTQRIIKWVD